MKCTSAEASQLADGRVEAASEQNKESLPEGHMNKRNTKRQSSKQVRAGRLSNLEADRRQRRAG